MDLTSLFLKLLLQDPTNGLEAWSNIKKAYLKGFDSVVLAINLYYTKHGNLPSFAELDIINRNMAVNTSLSIIKDVEVPESVDIDTVADALLDQFTQDSVLESLDKLLDNITLLDSHEIKEELANLSIKLEEQTHSSTEVVNMSDVSIVTNPEERTSTIDILVSNQFDEHSGGLGPGNLLLVGGYRGSGKSIFCCNIAVSQYQAGNVGVVFSIEMNKGEIFHRYMSILANVSHRDIKNATLNDVQLLKLAKARAGMFTESEPILESYKEHGDFDRLENDLKSTQLNPDNQLLIIDNPTITLTQIDLHLYKLKARFGDKLQMAVVDYVNVISVAGGTGQFDWQAQLDLSKGLKSLAAKHGILIIAPFQTKEDGSIKYSKAILDSPDVVFNMSVVDDVMVLESIKTRDIAPIDLCVGIDWNTLRIDPTFRSLPSKIDDDDEEEHRGLKKLQAGKDDV